MHVGLRNTLLASAAQHSSDAKEPIHTINVEWDPIWQAAISAKPDMKSVYQFVLQKLHTLSIAPSSLPKLLPKIYEKVEFNIGQRDALDDLAKLTGALLQNPQ